MAIHARAVAVMRFYPLGFNRDREKKMELCYSKCWAYQRWTPTTLRLLGLLLKNRLEGDWRGKGWSHVTCFWLAHHMDLPSLRLQKHNNMEEKGFKMEAMKMRHSDGRPQKVSACQPTLAFLFCIYRYRLICICMSNKETQSSIILQRSKTFHVQLVGDTTWYEQ